MRPSLWEDFFAVLNAKERQIVMRLRNGVAQVGEIAREIGYANHSPSPRSSRLSGARRPCCSASRTRTTEAAARGRALGSANLREPGRRAFDVASGAPAQPRNRRAGVAVTGEGRTCRSRGAFD